MTQQAKPDHGDTRTLTPERIMQFSWGYAVPLAIEAAVQNRVFDLLHEQGPMNAARLSEKTGTSSRGLRMLLNLLVSIDLLRRQDNRYSLTPESEAFLVSSKPQFQGGIFKHISTQLLPKWMRLSEIVRSGTPATQVNDEAQGGAFFQQFVEDIFSMSYRPAQVLADHLNVADAQSEIKVLDIAAGSGVWGIALAEKSPRVQVTAVDWPAVIPVTRRVASRHDVADRFSFIEGDILTVEFPRGFHIATLGHILHSEGEQRSRQLIRRVFQALAPGGSIAIAEFIANDDRSGPANALIFALNMLVHTEAGDAFTFAEMSSWLREAGFINPRTLDAPGPSPLILATKPS